MAHRITRTHEFCAGHRVCGHEGRCAHLHGHGYVAGFTCEAAELDALGRVIDFGVIKAKLCQWLEEHWDHRMLIWVHDPLLERLQDLDPHVTPVPFNPTAEHMAQYLCEHIGPWHLAGTGVRLVACTMQETGKCSATYSVDPEPVEVAWSEPARQSVADDVAAVTE